ncbi:hypothetical protein MAR_018265 [Mya arenaria]|uniref:VWFA domain-containing protein n=1 Tax=Mya arenaria TaxID=6604 RepID=A0ABY7EHF3_MYAAR|nr:hypothetical protein MAR_018265 [Mya arenaria]
MAMMEWHLLMRKEMGEGHDSGIKDLGGVHNIILVDISESMEGAWPEVTAFFNDYISGLEFFATQGIDEEHVALVTFGHETKVQQRLTNKYRSLKTAFSQLKVGGPSPLTAGILMTFAAAGSSEHQICVMNGIVVPSRVILITDGEPTDTSLYMGPDEATPSQLDETRSQVISEMEQARKFSLDVFFVPVGRANREFINLMAAVVNGKFQCGRLGGLISSSVSLSERDKSDIKEIKEKAFEKLVRNPSDDDDSYKEKSDCDLPVQGSRVRRGPEWRYDDDQDKGLAGTIVGHCDDGRRVWVDWDTPGSFLFHYRYGQGGAYDVILVDEKRRLGVGEIMAVGCQVKPGPGWKSSNTDIGLQCIGVVLRIHMAGAVPKALVRWENGARGEYSYMTESHSLPEIQLVFMKKFRTFNGISIKQLFSIPVQQRKELVVVKEEVEVNEDLLYLFNGELPMEDERPFLAVLRPPSLVRKAGLAVNCTPLVSGNRPDITELQLGDVAGSERRTAPSEGRLFLETKSQETYQGNFLSPLVQK